MKIHQVSTLKIILSLLFLNLVISYFLGYIIEHYVDSSIFSNPFETNYSKIKILVLTVLIAPIFETLIFQMAIIELFMLFTKNSYIKVIAIAVATILFSLNHAFNIYYMGATLFTGFIYAFNYLILRDRNKFLAFVGTFIIHAAHNLAAFLEDILTK